MYTIIDGGNIRKYWIYLCNCSEIITPQLHKCCTKLRMVKRYVTIFCFLVHEFSFSCTSFEVFWDESVLLCWRDELLLTEPS